MAATAGNGLVAGARRATAVEILWNGDMECMPASPAVPPTVSGRMARRLNCRAWAITAQTPDGGTGTQPPRAKRKL
jgi:hypothetical protein